MDDPVPTPPDGVPVFGHPAWAEFVDRASREVVDLPGRIACLPGWRLSDGEGVLRRRFEFMDEAHALRFLNFAAGTGARFGVRVDLDLRRQGIGVRVRASRGQTLREDELAAATELHAGALKLGAVRGARG